ncbi:MAG: hypothetical protein A3G76_16110 [Acidobacteria bacterium RIFCSPLOWO2_12_FULL_65_11]|nr:MAG: hypothetical protein A3H95_17215 [Acidobacteria bacterium RIFCSPLOWO2_02_FULL_64_15]OFW33875.1 MAG: hypothetical protein A3G76_16110 [Acidobacteria bacterium RIFCSPLOWO2_12_FULL_65_11]
MALSAGTRLGAYEIVALIGIGGMGEVYRAHDGKLNRDVALKVLPEIFVTDPDRVARFQREAQVLAALNHPHIAAIYGFEEAGPTRFLAAGRPRNGPGLAASCFTPRLMARSWSFLIASMADPSELRSRGPGRVAGLR